jgi:hypothetical protein
MENTGIKVQTAEISIIHAESSEEARKSIEHHVWNFIDYYKADLIDYQISYTSYMHPKFGLTLGSLTVLRISNPSEYRSL